MRPEVGLAFERCLEAPRPEPAVRLLACQDGIDPFARFADDPLVLQHVTKIAEALQPIRQFLPTAMALAFWVSPRVVFELAPLGNLRQSTGHAVGFEHELMPQPAFWLNAANGKLDQSARNQWIA